LSDKNSEKLELTIEDVPDMDEFMIEKFLEKCRKLRISKNADYGRSWEMMRSVGLTDIILVKTHRLRSFEEKGKLNHEGVEDTLMDLINYVLYRWLKHRGRDEHRSTAVDVTGL
jgi:hypothetical protein